MRQVRATKTRLVGALWVGSIWMHPCCTHTPSASHKQLKLGKLFKLALQAMIIGKEEEKVITICYLG